MNPKIEKLRAEREKNCEKITALQNRNREIDESVRTMENTDIVGLVRERGLTPDMLAEMLASLRTSPLPNKDVKEESNESKEN